MIGNSKNRFLILDLFRGVASLLVVGMHTFPEMGSFWPVVDFFFVLSGFVIAPMYFEINNAANVIRSRLVRLWPTIFFAVSLTILIQSFIALKDSLTSTGDLHTQFPTIIQVISGYFFLQVFFPSLSFSNGPLWSTSVELIINLILLPLISIFKKKSLIFIIGIGEILYFAGLTLDQVNVEFHGPVYYLEGLGRGLMGITLGIYVRSIFLATTLRISIAIRILVGCISLLVVGGLVHFLDYESAGLNFIFFGFLVFVSASTKIPSKKLLINLSKISRKYSFGIFAVHVPIAPVIYLLTRFSWFFPNNDFLRSASMFFCNIVLSLVILKLHIRYSANFLDRFVSNMISKLM